MSKYPNLSLFGGIAAAITVSAVVAINFADRNISLVPQNNDTVAFVIPGSGAAKAPGGLIVSAAQAADGSGGTYGLGRAALPEEIAAWDVDVMPDGSGLPEGSGDVMTGEEVFADNCASCHGDFAEGVGNWPKLAGGWDTLDRKDPVKTVGSYWPYLSTVWDYVHRSMPFGAAQTLSDDDVYAITAYILYSNDIVDEEFTLTHENFLEVEMPNADGFIVDDRAETEYAQWRAEPCMENCKDSVEITMRASVLDVTPDEGGAEEDFEEAATEVNEEAPVVVAETATETEAEAEAEVTTEAEPETAALDMALVADGEKVFKKCKACHQVGDGAKNRTGPVLNGIVGAAAGAADGFKYSSALSDAGAEGLTWSEEELKAFLAKPKDYLKGTKMSFSGLRKDSDLDAIVEFLKAHPAE
ncbi:MULTISPECIES: c-type cytochrome [unclassified Marinovum]